MGKDERPENDRVANAKFDVQENISHRHLGWAVTFRNIYLTMIAFDDEIEFFLVSRKTQKESTQILRQKLDGCQFLNFSVKPFTETLHY